jgi:hypothetical protein
LYVDKSTGSFGNAGERFTGSLQQQLLTPVCFFHSVLTEKSEKKFFSFFSYFSIFQLQQRARVETTL